jgi:AcrR family transcriptional regulator
MDNQTEVSAIRRGRPKERSDNENRDRILSAAMTAFIDKGFAKATMTDIARSAGMSKRDLYVLFVDKTALFAETIKSCRHLILALPRPVGEDLAPLDALPLIFRLDLTGREAEERDALLNLIARESLLFPELNELLYDTGIIRSRELLMAWLSDQMEKGRIPRASTALLAGLLMDVTHGVLLPRRQRKGQIDRSWQRQEIMTRIAIILRGIETDMPQENEDA